MQKRLTVQIFAGLVAGAVTGLVINLLNLDQFAIIRQGLVEGLFYVGGQLFLRALQLLVVPVVLVSLVCGTAGLEDVKRLGRMGGKAVGLYLLTTATAVTTALTVAWLIAPGRGFDLRTETEFTAAEAPPVAESFIQMVPRNPVAALADGEMLQIIAFALLLGLAITMSGSSGKRVLSFFEELNVVVMKLVQLIITISPYGVFCLIARVFADQGFDAIMPLAAYFFTVLLVLILHLSCTYPLFLKYMGGLSPLVFIKKYNDVMFFAFSTASSNATIPVSLNAVQTKLGVDKSVASFTIPLGATINMDGTAIMQGVATVFVANAYGIELGVQQYLLVILTATLASIGTAGVPGVGLIMLAMVFHQVGLPVEGIGVILAVDRLLDMVRTAVNVGGDGVVSCIVAHSENQLDRQIYYRRKNSADPAPEG